MRRDLRTLWREPTRGDRGVLLWAALASLLLHSLFLGGVRWPGQAEERELPSPPVMIRFVDGPTAPPEVPPETDFISDVDSVAQSPEITPEPVESPQPRLEGDLPNESPTDPIERQPSQPEPAPPPEPTPAEVAHDRPEEQQRRRVDDLLQTFQQPREWSDLLQEDHASSNLSGSFGGSDVTIESRADVDWGPYLRHLKRKVRENWRIPSAARIGIPGIVRLSFYIRHDGAIEDLQIEIDSGRTSLDIAARDAIANCDPLPPLPPSAEERVRVTYIFSYNVSDREYRLWKRQHGLR